MTFTAKPMKIVVVRPPVFPYKSIPSLKSNKKYSFCIDKMKRNILDDGADIHMAPN